MTAAHRRHDMTDEVWERLRPHLPCGEGKRGRPAHDNRRFIDAVCWILRTGAPWRDLPTDYGDWKNTHRPPRSSRGAKGFCRWRDRGEWARMLEAVMPSPPLSGCLPAPSGMALRRRRPGASLPDRTGCEPLLRAPPEMGPHVVVF